MDKRDEEEKQKKKKESKALSSKAKGKEKKEKDSSKEIVKKENHFTIKGDIKSSTVKLKSRAPDGSSKGKIDSSAVRKKVESSSKLPADSKMKSVSTVTKSEVLLSISLRN